MYRKFSYVAHWNKDWLSQNSVKFLWNGLLHRNFSEKSNVRSRVKFSCGPQSCMEASSSFLELWWVSSSSEWMFIQPAILSGMSIKRLPGWLADRRDLDVSSKSSPWKNRIFFIQPRMKMIFIWNCSPRWNYNFLVLIFFSFVIINILKK